jgi:hypothetical protein
MSTTPKRDATVPAGKRALAALLLLCCAVAHGRSL